MPRSTRRLKRVRPGVADKLEDAPVLSEEPNCPGVHGRGELAVFGLGGDSKDSITLSRPGARPVVGCGGALVVGMLPGRQSQLRLTGALEEQEDEWAVVATSVPSPMNKLYEPAQEQVVPALLELQSA